MRGVRILDRSSVSRRSETEEESQLDGGVIDDREATTIIQACVGEERGEAGHGMARRGRAWNKDGQGKAWRGRVRQGLEQGVRVLARIGMDEVCALYVQRAGKPEDRQKQEKIQWTSTKLR